MRYDFADLPITSLIGPVADATAALARLDERVARSAVGQGWLSRSHFADACASLWVDGELVHLEDLVLHDGELGARRPTHVVTVAHDIVRTRRRILGHPPAWPLSSEGIRHLRKGDDASLAPLETKSLAHLALLPTDEGEPLAAELQAIDAVLARSEALLARARGAWQGPSAADPDALIYEPDWNEDERLSEWRHVVTHTETFPAVLRAAVLLDAWNCIEVLQHAPWLGRLLATAALRANGLTNSYLLPISVGLRDVPRARRNDRNRDVRISALIDAIRHAADFGLREHDRLLLVRQQMEHRLVGRRSSSKLPHLIELVLEKPFVSMSMIVDDLSVTPQGALRLVADLNLRELTGRGRFRAWGVL